MFLQPVVWAEEFAFSNNWPNPQSNVIMRVITLIIVNYILRYHKRPGCFSLLFFEVLMFNHVNTVARNDLKGKASWFKILERMFETEWRQI